MLLFLLLPLVAQVQLQFLPDESKLANLMTRLNISLVLLLGNRNKIYDQAQHFFGPPAVGFGVGLVSVYRLKLKKLPWEEGDINLGAFLRFPLNEIIVEIGGIFF